MYLLTIINEPTNLTVIVESIFVVVTVAALIVNLRKSLKA